MQNTKCTNDILQDILKHHSNSQATIETLEKQLEQIKKLKGASIESFKKKQQETEEMEDSANKMILSSSQSLNNVEIDTDSWFCSTLVNKHTSKDFDFDGFSPIKKKKEKILNYNKVITNIKSTELSVDSLQNEINVQHENSDELGHLFDTIMKTGQKLTNELQESRYRETILSQKLLESQEKHEKALHKSRDKQFRELDQDEMKSTCSKLQTALNSLQQDNLELNSKLIETEIKKNSLNNDKLLQFHTLENCLKNAEMEKRNLQIKLHEALTKIEQLVNNNKQNRSCECSRIPDLKSALKKSHEMIDEGIHQRKQLHQLLAKKETELTDLQIQIDKLQILLHQKEQEVRSGDIEELLAKYEKLKQLHLQTLKELHGLEQTKQKSSVSWRPDSSLTASDQLPDYLQFRSNKQLDDQRSYQNNIRNRSSIALVTDNRNLIHSTPQKENSRSSEKSFNTFTTSSDLPTETMSVLEKFNDFTVAMTAGDVLESKGGGIFSISADNNFEKGTKSEDRDKLSAEIGFSRSQQDYVDDLVKKYTQQARGDYNVT